MTNGVHVPSWASKAADKLWAEADEFALRAREPGALRRAEAAIVPLRETTRANAWVVFEGAAPAARPAEHFTPRAVPYHPSARVPAESSGICWAR